MQRQGEHTGAKEYNRFNESLSAREHSEKFLTNIGLNDVRQAEIVLGSVVLGAFTSCGFSARGFREIAGAIVQFEALIAQGWVHDLDLDLAI